VRWFDDNIPTVIYLLLVPEPACDRPERDLSVFLAAGFVAGPAGWTVIAAALTSNGMP
jgi:hypothetical protein